MAVVLCAAALSLTACSRAVRSPADEIAMYSWRGELESGKTAHLRFSDREAYLTARGEDFELEVSGVCAIYDDSFVIYDSQTHNDYSFYYTLRGDSLELSYAGGAIELDKI